MTIHPLGENGFLVEINSDYIQQLYRERDEALARNRDLHVWLDAANRQIHRMDVETVKAIVDGDALRILAQEWQQLVQDYEDMELQDPLDQYALWDERWKALKKRTEQLTGKKL